MTKEDVLALLEKSDAPVSGEQMCRALGMTRAGVWKAIEALRADGFDIEAAPRRGYRLCSVSGERRQDQQGTQLHGPHLLLFQRHAQQLYHDLQHHYPVKQLHRQKFLIRFPAGRPTLKIIKEEFS